jgi:predicted polyphosphate/ATP-dependent NAD kinase
LYYISESIPGTDQFIQDHFNDVDIFVAIGGDGTISTVARNLIDTEKILAIFPAGSGNGFPMKPSSAKIWTNFWKKSKKKFQKD